MDGNLVVEVWFNIRKDRDGFPKSRSREALLCKPENPECSICRIASVPFYLKEVSYGDQIATTTKELGVLEFDRVLARGGYSTCRILLHNSSSKQQVVGTLLEMDAVVEIEDDLIAVGIPHTNADEIYDYIVQGKDSGMWGAQDGYLYDGQ